MPKTFFRKKSISRPGTGDGTRGEEAYQKIRTGILKGEFPPSAVLSEYQLATQFNLSRTPVREALTRLEHEGMIRTVPGRGAFVAELTPHDIMEIYEVREQLESYAARMAAERMEAEDIAKLGKIIEEMHECSAAGYTRETFETDISLHKTIIRSTQNQRMFAILATLDDQMHRIRSMWPRTPRWLDGTLEEHDQIVKCIKKGDPDGAEQAMRRHLRSSCEHALRFLMPMRKD
ncbi:MAG TPA: GntR family transcriptional regulator [Terriglobales bacterium]|nr:GntR family transcriptional regulator [Terriglobales bacterium]